MSSMNPWIKRALYAIAILALAALLILSFQKNFEYVEKTQWQPLSGEARSNPLYAGMLFLRRMGIPTETIDSLQDLTTLPDTDTVLLISSSRQTLRDEQVSNLLDWVKSGGHLIIAGITDWNSYFSDDSLVNEPNDGVGDESERSEGEGAGTEDDEVYYDEDEMAEALASLPTIDALQEFLDVELREKIQFDDDKTPEKISIKGSDKPLELGPYYYNSIVLRDKNTASKLEQIAINGKNFAIRQPVEDGLITLVSDFAFINNYKIGEYDHAEILWNIVRGKPMLAGASGLQLPRAIWLIHSDERASLFAVIWKTWWALVITLAMLFVFWILRVSRRFGPVIAKETEDRRNLLEHIDASGAYYWKQKNQAILLESTRQAAQQQLAKSIPGWQAMSQQDQIQLLAKRLKMNESPLAKILYGNIANSAHEFTETIKQLEHIRTSL